MHKQAVWFITVTLCGMNNNYKLAQTLDSALFLDNISAIEKITQMVSGEPVKHFPSQSLFFWLLRYKNQKYLSQIASVIDIKTVTYNQTGVSLLERALESPFLQSSLIFNLVALYRCKVRSSLAEIVGTVLKRFPQESWFAAERNRMRRLLTCYPLPIHYAALQGDCDAIARYQGDINVCDTQGSTPLFYALPSPCATRCIIAKGGYLAANNESFDIQYTSLINICLEYAKVRGRDCVYSFYIDSLCQVMSAFPDSISPLLGNLLPQLALLDTRLLQKAYELEPRIIFARSKDGSFVDYLVSYYAKKHIASVSWSVRDEALCLRDAIRLLIDRGAPVADTKKCAELDLLPPREKEKPLPFSLNQACNFMDYAPEELGLSLKCDSPVLSMSTDSKVSRISE